MTCFKAHLNKSSSGPRYVETACGRNIFSTSLITIIQWHYFREMPAEQQCAKCAASKQAAINARRDQARNAALKLETCKLAGQLGWYVLVDEMLDCDIPQFRTEEEARILAGRAYPGAKPCLTTANPDHFSNLPK